MAMCTVADFSQGMPDFVHLNPRMLHANMFLQSQSFQVV